MSSRHRDDDGPDRKRRREDDDDVPKGDASGNEISLSIEETNRYGFHADQKKKSVCVCNWQYVVKPTAVPGRLDNPLLAFVCINCIIVRPLPTVSS